MLDWRAMEIEIESRRKIWATYARWAFCVGLVFFLVYPSCNWLTSTRETTYPLYLEMELSIPFVPEFFWLYISMYSLFLLPPFFLNIAQLRVLGKQSIWGTMVAGVLFLLIPSELGFERISPSSPLYSSLFSQLFTIDLPHNLVPSLHIIFSAIIIFSLLEAIHKPVYKTLIYLWLILLCLSTVLVHQHHLLDVILGLFIAITLKLYYKKGDKHA